MADVNEVLDNLSILISKKPDIKILVSIVSIILIWGLRNVFLNWVKNFVEEADVIHMWDRLSKYIILFTILMLLVRLWIQETQPIITFLGLTAAAFTIVSKEFILNAVGSLVIFARSLFSVGDRIQIGDFTGDVEDIGIIYITLVEVSSSSELSTGRILKVPNSQVLTRTVVNYSRSLKSLWNEISFSITHDSNYELVKEILLFSAEKYSKTFTQNEMRILRKNMIDLFRYKSLAPKVYLEINDLGIKMILRYLCDYKNRKDSELHIWEDTLKELKGREDVRFSHIYLD